MDLSKLKRVCVSALAATAVIIGARAAESETEPVSYVPNVHGTLRPRFEMSTDNAEGRFEVRNARLSLDGKIARPIDYYMQVDLCDQGSFKVLDFWARIKIADGLSFQAGQFRMPFGVDPFSAPHNYIFANRSFIGKQICNFRAVGAKVSYQFAKLPLLLEAGVFNSSGIGQHDTWSKDYAFAAKGTYTLGDFKLSTGFQSIKPGGVRTNLVDGCISWSMGRWLVEGEYMYKHYTGGMHDACHGYNAFVDYHMPIKAGIFNKLSFQGRFDGMTDHSNARLDDDGLLSTTDAARNRITIGSTISYVRTKSMYLDIRANYEKYFYGSDVTPTTGNNDKIVLEMVIRF